MLTLLTVQKSILGHFFLSVYMLYAFPLVETEKQHFRRKKKNCKHVCFSEGDLEYGISILLHFVRNESHL